MPIYLEPRRFRASSDYAAVSGDRLTLIRPAHHLGLTSPLYFGAQRPDFSSSLDRDVPYVGVLAGEGLAIAGQEGTLCALDGSILIDHSWYRGHSSEMYMIEPLAEKAHLGGRTLSLCSESAFNYAHFILDVMPRAFLVEQAGYSLAAFDHIVVRVPNDFCRGLLAALGVSLKQCIAPRHGLLLTADFLVAPTFPGIRRNTEPWAAQFLRSRFAGSDHADSPGRSIYVLRSKRRPSNQEELVSIAANYGVEVFSPEQDVAAQIRTFQEADLVIGPHGAGLSNLVFSRPSTRVLELIPRKRPLPYFYTLSMNANLSYAAVLGDAQMPPDAGSDDPQSDFHVNAYAFEQALEYHARALDLRNQR